MKFFRVSIVLPAPESTAVTSQFLAESASPDASFTVVLPTGRLTDAVPNVFPVFESRSRSVPFLIALPVMFRTVTSNAALPSAPLYNTGAAKPMRAEFNAPAGNTSFG